MLRISAEYESQMKLTLQWSIHKYTHTKMKKVRGDWKKIDPNQTRLRRKKTPVLSRVIFNLLFPIVYYIPLLFDVNNDKNA